MCDYCLPIFGRGAKPHNITSCVLRQSAMCVICGPGKHETSECPRRNQNKVTSESVQSICIRKPGKDRPYFLSGTAESYIEFCKVHDINIDRHKETNERRIRLYLEARGLTLSTPVKPPPPISAELTSCGHRHGMNELCREIKISAKK
jgi:hypothetical protein